MSYWVQVLTDLWYNTGFQVLGDVHCVEGVQMTGRILLALLILAIPSIARADYLEYLAFDTDSDFDALVQATVIVTYVPNGSQATLSPGGIVTVPLSGSVFVDTGLPSSFDGGSHGIQLQDLDLYAEAAPGSSLYTFSDLTMLAGVPISLSANITAVSVAFAPATTLSASLSPSGAVDGYLWGPVNHDAVITLHGSLVASIFAIGTVELWNSATDDPMVGTAEVPFEGEFWGEEDGTVVALTSSISSLPVFTDVGGSGVVSWNASVTVSDITVAALASNPTTLVPEPSAAVLAAVAGLSIGLLGVWRRH